MVYFEEMTWLVGKRWRGLCLWSKEASGRGPLTKTVRGPLAPRRAAKRDATFQAIMGGEQATGALSRYVLAIGLDTPDNDTCSVTN